jgi:hypothetical protein
LDHHATPKHKDGRDLAMQPSPPHRNRGELLTRLHEIAAIVVHPG